jgi:SAM-dependent methyltransferase
MKNKIPENIWHILSCPNCNSDLIVSTMGANCSFCDSKYIYNNNGNIDLRLPKQKKYSYEFKLGDKSPLIKDFDFKKLLNKDNPEVDFSDLDVPRHLTKILLSYFPKAETKDAMMLDLGCGDMVHEKIGKHAGFAYVGLDYESKNATILGDAHALPFKDNCFDFILSIAVLEHIRFPFVAMKEAYRVLKQNGRFIGTVAFLEPFHGDSFYHHTHLGLYNVLKDVGFTIDKICPSSEYSVLMAQAKMGLFPKMPLFISHSILMPIHLLHKVWWKMGGVFSKKSSEDIRIRNTTGVFTFLAKK